MLGRRKSSRLSQPGQTCGPRGDQLAQFVRDFPSFSPASPMSWFAWGDLSLYLWPLSPLDQLQRRPSGLCEDTVRTQPGRPFQLH